MAAAEVHLHFVERGERHFELGAVDEDARHAETERAVEAVAGAAGEDGGARVDRAWAAVRRADGHRLGCARDAGDAHAGLDGGAGGDSRRGEIAIEERAVDDCRADAAALDHDRGAVGRNEAGAIRRADNRSTREVQLVEGVEAEDARAVHRRADEVVFFEDADRETSRGELARRDESRRAAANHHHVTIGTVLAVAAIGRQYLRPLDSHVPSTLIQNESRIKRRSSHIDCRRT